MARTPRAERKTGFWPPLGMWPLGRPWRPPPPSAHGAPFRYITRRAPFVTRAAKGAWKVSISASVYLRDVHLWDVPRTTHAKEQQEAHLRAPASLRLDPPCPRRARLDQNTRAWRTWSLLWGTEVRKSSRKPECVETRATKTSRKLRNALRPLFSYRYSVFTLWVQGPWYRSFPLRKNYIAKLLVHIREGSPAAAYPGSGQVGAQRVCLGLGIP